MLAACGSPVGGMNTAASSNGPVIITLTATPPLVAYNKTADIKWSSPDSTSCSSSPAGINSTSGTFTTPPLTATTTYTVTCVGASGTASQSITISVVPTSIIGAAATWAAEPVRGTVYYYCDCGTGKSGSCVAGDDTNAGKSSSAPRRTISNAMTLMGSLSGTNTFALCQGGAFDATSRIGASASGCTPGTTCADIREYLPPSKDTAKPIINMASNIHLFHIEGNYGGVRIFNLKLVGDNNPADINNIAFWFYNGAHDIEIGNVDIVNFSTGMDNENGGASPTSNIRMTGNTFTNNSRFAYFGGSSGTKINYNIFEGSGNGNSLIHTIYEDNYGLIAYNVEIIGNYFHGQYGATCQGSVLSSHGAIDGLSVKDNIVSIDATATTGGCYGLEFSNMTNDKNPTFFRHAVFSGNTIINGGNTSFMVTSCPGCIIENNIIISDWAYSGNMNGISIAGSANRGIDDTSNANIIRNNTVWYGPKVIGTGVGILTNTEGTGHIISNNTVTSVQGSGALNCFRHDLLLTSYAFMDNNHCYGTGTTHYEYTHGTNLTAWQTYTTSNGFDAHSIGGAPVFVNAASANGYDFHPNTGSPLRNAGDATNKSTLDFAGVTRPNPPAMPAIGAYEP